MTKNTAAQFEDQFAFLQDDGLGGFDHMTADTVSIPFLRVLQQLSPQLDDSRPEYIEGAKKGLLCSPTLGKLYDPPLEVVVGRFDRYFIEWKPERGGFAGAHQPDYVAAELAAGALQRNERGIVYDPRTRNEFSDTYVYYIILPEHLEDGMMLLTLSSTQLKEARKWNRNLLSMVIPGTNQRAKPYYTKWAITTPTMKNDRGSWAGFKVDFVGWVSQEQFNAVCAERAALPATAAPDLAQLDAGPAAEREAIETTAGYGSESEDLPF